MLTTSLLNIGGYVSTSITPAQYQEMSGDSTVFDGIAGTEVSPITFNAGSGANFVRSSDAIAFATLDTGNANDPLDGSDRVQVVYPEPRTPVQVVPPPGIPGDIRDDFLQQFVQFGHGAYKATIRTGAGPDVVNVQSFENSGYVRLSPQDPPAYDRPDYYDSIVDVGTGDDYVYGFLPYKTQFFGGDGVDTLFLYGCYRDWSYQVVDGNSDGRLDIDSSDDSVDYMVWNASTNLSGTAINNSVRGFELFQFNDILLDVREKLAIIGSGLSVNEGGQADFQIILDHDGLKSGQTVVFTLKMRSGSAEVGADLAQLNADSLQAQAGVDLQIVDLNTASGEIKVQVTATNDLDRGATIAALSVPIVADNVGELAGPEDYFVDLAGFGQTSTAHGLIGPDPNSPPVVVSRIDDQRARPGNFFFFPISESTFNDSDVNDSLTLTASLADGGPLPAWLTFDPATQAFSGTPSSSDIGIISISLAASDLQLASAATEFDIMVDAASLPAASSPRVLNYGYAVTGTIGPGLPTNVVPLALSDDIQYREPPVNTPNDFIPDELKGRFDYDLYFKFTKKDVLGDNGQVVSTSYEFNKDDLTGLKVPVRVDNPDLKVVTEGDDNLRAIGFTPAALTPHINAMELATLRLGGGNDHFQVKGDGIAQSIRSQVDIDASRGYVFQSNIFGGEGDDDIRPYMPYASTFSGGPSTNYHDAIYDPTGEGFPVTLGPSLLPEEVSYGDYIELKGSRFDWDIEFKDGNGDGSVTLDSILGEEDYLALSNNNKVSGFERIRFGDIYFDLLLSRQVDQVKIYGQPDYYLNGSENPASELNSDIQKDSGLWSAFRFNRIKLDGIVGTATDPVTVFTGDSEDTPFILGALRFASLSTEQGSDIVNLGGSDQSSIDLGPGLDQIVISGEVLQTTINAGEGGDSLILGSLANSQIIGSGGDDVVQIDGSTVSTAFYGDDLLGSALGGNDTLILPSSLSSYALELASDPVSSVLSFRDGRANLYSGFENYVFADGSYTSAQLQQAFGGDGATLSDLVIGIVGQTSIEEGLSASYGVYLQGVGLDVGRSVDLTLRVRGIDATETVDYAALTPDLLNASPGVSLGGISVDPVSRAISLTVVNSGQSGLSPSAQLLTFSLATIADKLAESDEAISVELTSASARIREGMSSILTTIVNKNASVVGGGVTINADPAVASSQNLLGTSGPDIITSLSGSDLLDGGPGADKLIGGLGSDQFRLAYGQDSIDQILDFNPNEDLLVVQDVVTGSFLGRFLDGATQSSKVLSVVKSARKAASAASPIAYDSRSGRVYLNDNGARKGFGADGGAIAELSPFIKLRSDDFLFSYSLPV